MTPSDRLEEGADGIMVGRPILESKNPIETVDAILRERGASP